jgi:hypothetical protein
VYVGLDDLGARPRSLAQRIARAFGAVANPAAGGSGELEGLLEVLAGLPPTQRAPLIVVDGVIPGSWAAAEVAVLARAARSTRYFSLLVVGPEELATDLIGPDAADAADAVVTVPPLTLPQVRPYLASWLAATRPPEAPPLIVTVDAALLVGHRAGGNLRRINALAREMIASGGVALTSWDAWTASDGTGHRTGDLEVPRVRPPGWPTPEIVQLINRCRVAAGLAERGPAA